MMEMKKIILAVFLIILLVAGLVYYMTRPSPYLPTVTTHKYRLEQLSKPDYLTKLINYTNSSLNDSIKGLDFKQLLKWQHKYMVYPASDAHKVMWKTKVDLEGRPADPIKILSSQFRVYDPLDQRVKAMGKCGEFAWVYICSLIANGIDCRLVVDCSAKTDNRTAGDHVWIEVWVNRAWLHVDPTENKIDQPDLYAVGWNKNVNLVYAITVDEVIDVTDTYRGVN